MSAYPMESRFYQTEPDVQVLVQTQQPRGIPLGEVVIVHGLEGAGDAGYVKSMAWKALQSGFIAHRFHMRTCGGTEHLCPTLYHAGLTSDLLFFLRQLAAERAGAYPVFLVGFSLGGNVVLKLAGELGDTRLIAAVCSISTPIDLAACAKRIGERDNRLYERRFLKRMRQRLLATKRYSREQLAAPRSIYEIDDRLTAPAFGFRGADHYYATQSANQFLDRIRVPGLLIHAKDDTFVPFAVYDRSAIWANPYLRLIAPDHGGHLGFLAREAPRFWVDETVMEWLGQIVEAPNRVPALPSESVK